MRRQGTAKKKQKKRRPAAWPVSARVLAKHTVKKHGFVSRRDYTRADPQPEANCSLAPGYCLETTQIGRRYSLVKEIVAVIFGLGLLCNALLFVPQALAVWRKKTDEGISLITFGGFSILQAIGIVHGLYQQDLSLILGMAASLLSCGTVTFLTLFYRMRRLRGAAQR